MSDRTGKNGAKCAYYKAQEYYREAPKAKGHPKRHGAARYRIMESLVASQQRWCRVQDNRSPAR
jgi:hypothetical protein